MNCAALFAGIGGIELGLERAGHRTRLLCENDPGARAVLNHRFAGVPFHDDVRTLRDLPTGLDLLTAGFPCQDLSQAGGTAGIGGVRSGLVAEVFRLLSRQRVPWVLLENVPFMLQLAGGQAMEVVVSALEALGYRWAYRVMNSKAFGLPQRRERVYLLASLEDDPRDVLLAADAGAEPERGDWRRYACGFYWTEGIRGLGWAVDAIPTLKGGSTIGIPSQPAIVFPDGRVAKPDLRDAERLQGFDVNWTEPAERAARRGFRWKLVGNSVSVPAAEWIGHSLLAPGTYNGDRDKPMQRKSAWPRAAWNMGEGRRVSMVSSFPVAVDAPALAEFLRFPVELLSARATRGFLSRTEVSCLRFPAGFIDVLRAHLNTVEEPLLVA
jgi:DNA (cytosine-5)-methyltransferase 1